MSKWTSLGMGISASFTEQVEASGAGRLTARGHKKGFLPGLGSNQGAFPVSCETSFGAGSCARVNPDPRKTSTAAVARIGTSSPSWLCFCL